MNPLLAALLVPYGLTDEAEANLAALAVLPRPRLMALGAELLGNFDGIRAGEVDGVEPDDVEALRELAEAVEVVDAERDRRGEPAVPDPAVVASGVPTTPALPDLGSITPPAQFAARTRPASAAHGESRHGRPVETLADLAVAFGEFQTELGGYGAPTSMERHRVATMRGAYPEDRRLSDGDVHRNDALVASATQALVASGGFCAPPDVRYDQLVVATDARPVRDALLRFGADRGAVTVTPTPRLTDVASGVGVWSNATDIAPGGSTKNLVIASCPAAVTVSADAVTKRIRFGNFQMQAYPERVAALLELLGAQHARTAEQNLLDKIGTGSTAVTTTKVLGAARDLLANFAQAAAAQRSRHRMPPDAVLSVFVPAFARDMIRADLIRQAPGDDALAVADAEITGYLTAQHLVPTWYLDTQTGAGQVIGAQGPTDLRNWPSTVRWYLFAPGSWIFVDAGQLDLGIVRDATLVSTNDAEMFAETFENAAFVGVESLAVTSTVCADGDVALAVTTANLCAAS